MEQDVGDTPRVGQDQQEKQQQQQRQPAAVIVIDDDEAEFVNVSDMSCQATFEDIENETCDREKEKTLNRNQNSSSTAKQQTEQSDILKNYVPIRPAPVKESINSSVVVLQTPTSSVLQQTISKQSEVVASSVTSAGKTPPVIYRTLKSPVESGLPLLPQRVALKSSPPSLPVQQVISSLQSSSGAAPSVSSGDNRYVFHKSEYM